jgi:hypothetical protein
VVESPRRRSRDTTPGALGCSKAFPIPAGAHSKDTLSQCRRLCFYGHRSKKVGGYRQSSSAVSVAVLLIGVGFVELMVLIMRSRHEKAAIRDILTTRRIPGFGAGHEDAECRGAVCSAKESTQHHRMVSAREAGRSCGARLRG